MYIEIYVFSEYKSEFGIQKENKLTMETSVKYSDFVWNVNYYAMEFRVLYRCSSALAVR